MRVEVMLGDWGWGLEKCGGLTLFFYMFHSFILFFPFLDYDTHVFRCRREGGVRSISHMNKFVCPCAPTRIYKHTFSASFHRQMVAKMFHMTNSLKLFIGFVFGIQVMPCHAYGAAAAIAAYNYWCCWCWWWQWIREGDYGYVDAV